MYVVAIVLDPLLHDLLYHYQGFIQDFVLGGGGYFVMLLPGTRSMPI